MCVYWGRFVHVYVYLACVYIGVGMYVCKYTWHKYILRWVFMSVCILEYVLGWRWGVLGRPSPLSVIEIK